MCHLSIGHPPEQIFAAWLNPALIRQWIFAPKPGEQVLRVENDPRVGGTFIFSLLRGGQEIEHAGEYLELVPSQRIVFTWGLPQESPDQDRVTVEIVPLPGGVAITVMHEMLPEWAEYISHTEAAWSRMLAAMDTMLLNLQN